MRWELAVAAALSLGIHLAVSQIPLHAPTVSKKAAGRHLEVVMGDGGALRKAVEQTRKTRETEELETRRTGPSAPAQRPHGFGSERPRPRPSAGPPKRVKAPKAAQKKEKLQAEPQKVAPPEAPPPSEPHGEKDKALPEDPLPWRSTVEGTRRGPEGIYGTEEAYGLGTADAAAVSKGPSTSAPTSKDLGGAEPPRYRYNPAPKYPAVAKRRGYEGTTLLLVEVLPDGVVGSVEVLRSSGHEVLDRSAVRAVKRWRFVPAEMDGRPVAMHVRIPVRFELR